MRELERRRTLGIVAPDPVPHPDHIRIDLRTGNLGILGPLTKEEKADLETWRRYKLFFQETNEGLGLLLAEGGDEQMSVQEIEEQMLANQRCIDLIEKMLKAGRPMRLPVLPDDILIL